MIDTVLAIVALGFLIFVHELGHFLVAKWFGVKVLEFAIGFGPVAFRRQFGETTYSLRTVPLGGFVRMAGDTPQDCEEQEEASDVEKSRWFLTQAFVPKFLIVFAGPLFNLVFAVVLAALAAFTYGRAVLIEESVIGEVIPGHPAERAGLARGDRVVSINDQPITLWDEISEKVRESQGAELSFGVVREGEDGASTTLTISVVPEDEVTELDAIAGTTDDRQFRIGIFPDIYREQVGFFESVHLGVSQVLFVCEITYRGLKGMVLGQVSTKNLAGPLFIFKQGREAAKSGFDKLIDFTVLLSVSLGLLNLLPIPILDGGHLLFFTIEALKGSPISYRVQERAAQVGMLFLLMLMIFAISNDVRRIFADWL